MKKIIFIFIPLLLIFSCAKKDLTTFESETDHSARMQVDFGPIGIELYGAWISNSNDVPYWADSVGSWLYIRWNTDMQGGMTDVKVYRVEDMTTPLDYTSTWEYGNLYSLQILKPKGNLLPNQTYVVVFKANGIKDAYGNSFDIDNDGKMGEVRDDDYYRSFSTRKDDGNPSVTKPIREDLFNPFSFSPFPMHPTDTTAILTDWFYDARLCIYILDYKPDTAGGWLRSSLDGSTVNTNNIKLFDKLTGEEISGTITYQSDTAATQWGRLLFTPSANLTPGKTYLFRLYGDALKDPAGNKLAKVYPGIIDYEFTVINKSTIIGDSLTGDYVPPTVVGWGTATQPKILFSEVVDRSTINSATIFSYGIQLTFNIANEYYNGKNVTAVYFYRIDGESMSGKTIYVRGIKDTAGNIMSGEQQHTY